MEHYIIWLQKTTRLSFIICSAIQAYDEDLIVYGLSGSEIIKVADLMGMKSLQEVFADRTYQEDGSLTPRSKQSIDRRYCTGVGTGSSNGN